MCSPWQLRPLVVGFLYLGCLSSFMTIAQLRAPAELRGRVMSTLMVLLGTLYPLGAILQGAIADEIGLRATTAGAAALTTLGGETAYQWDLSVKGGRFQGLEVVTVRDDVGWTLQLDDDQATYTAHVGQFRSMLSTFHFR